MKNLIITLTIALAGATASAENTAQALQQLNNWYNTPVPVGQRSINDNTMFNNHIQKQQQQQLLRQQQNQMFRMQQQQILNNTLLNQGK